MPASELCPTCRRSFTRQGMGTHWRRSDCPYPSLTDRQREIICGLLMGDGSRTGDNSLQVVMTNRSFLEWVADEMDQLTTGVQFGSDGEEAARRSIEGEGVLEEMPEDPKDKYRIRFRLTPEIREYREWYASGRKRWPDDLELTPLITKIWYAGDGGLSWTGGAVSAYVRFGVVNEADRIDWLIALFTDLGLSPSYSPPHLRFGHEDSADLLRWMGDPAPGFEYKWARTDRRRYERLKAKADAEGHDNRDGLVIEMNGWSDW